MAEKLTKKYGLFTAISMVVGTVIGSGVFFKAEKILTVTGGDLKTAILAWLLGGAIMLCCAYGFSIMATKYERVNGLVDYAEIAGGRRFAYYVGWFSCMIYTPSLTAVLAWVSARYTMVLFGSSDITGGACMVLAAFYLCGAYVLNTLAPLFAGKLQVTATVIKLIPLLLMGIIGTIAGLSNGVTVANFTTIPTVAEILQVRPDYVPVATPLLSAVVATAFAYEGWIIATTINAEIKDAKRNLPIALVAGSIIVVAVYILYYIGLAGAADNLVMIAGGETGAKVAFTNIFGNIGGTLLMVFIVISCLGTENGLMMGCTRGLYALAERGEGPNPWLFSQIAPRTFVPTNSAIWGLFVTMAWLVYFYGANLAPTPWFGFLSFDASELPVVTLYAVYIPIYAYLMWKETELGFFRRYLAPLAAILCSMFMVYAAIVSHGWRAIGGYLVVFVIIMLPSIFFRRHPPMVLGEREKTTAEQKQ